ncbi:MAG: hypothetical protein KBF74_02500 [Ferruginibacter sp.]|nr:hypothetical protein [Ferruginibacter sp.]
MKINGKAALQEKILELENLKVVQEEELKLQFHAVKESMKPSNLLKSGLSSLTSGPGLGGGLLKTAAGLGIGVLSKKIFLGSSPSFIKKVVGSVFEIAAANTTISHADKIKAYGISLYNNLFNKNEKRKTTDADVS